MSVRSILAWIAYLVALAILLALGTWQVQRLAWKNDLIARVESRVDAPPIDLPGADAWGTTGFVAANEYRPVTLRGRYVEPAGARDFARYHTFTLVARPRGAVGGQGYWSMALLELEAGGSVYVNRGFVPDAARGREAPPPAGPVTVTGLLRASNPGNRFTPPCETDTRICYVNDVVRVADLAGRDVAPFYVDLAAAFTPAGGLPQAGETRLAFPNNHLQYAVTWYGLAAALTGVFGVVLMRRLRR